MASEGRRAAIRRFYRMARTAVDKTQIEIEALARLDAGRYWKIENGFVFPTVDERKSVARALRINEADLPSEQATEARAS